jgi:hypothetical protein
MGRAEIYPFAAIGERPGQRYPDWIRGLKDANGAYIIYELPSRAIVYIGESHSDRLYGTLTRHFQHWSPDWDTSGPTYDRADVHVAVVVVPRTHAYRLQNDLICALGSPRDNRVICGADDPDRDPDDPGLNPRGYDYDIDAVIDALFTDFDEIAYAHDDDGAEMVPF